MPDTLATFHPRDFFALAPEIALTVCGLVVLLADVGWFRHRPAEARRLAVGRLAVAASLVSLLVSALPLAVRYDLYGLQSALNFARIDYLSDPDPYLFFGTLSGDVLSDTFNLLLAGLMVLIVWLSTVWPFTDDWGEYFALIFWSTVGMMLLTASEEFLTLFLTLETMTICLYLATAFEKTKRRSAEGGLKYFVYGSVSSALFLFGLSLVYGLTGTTQFFAIRHALAPVQGVSSGLAGNVAGATAVLLMLVGFGFKVAAVPFHQWAPDAYEGAPAPVTAWIATGSKVASFIAMMKVLLHALGPWERGAGGVMTPGWIGVVAVLSAASMTYGNFAALAQKNFKRMLAYSSIAHAGYMLVGVAAAGVSTRHEESAGSVLFYLVVYAFANVGAFALAAWLARDKGSDEIADLDGLAFRYPGLATCVLLLMLSLVGLPPLAGFFGKLYMFMEALNQEGTQGQGGRVTLIWLVALGLLNSVVSAFYYVRVLRAMFLRPPVGAPLAPAPTPVVVSIALATAVTLALGVSPAPVVNVLKSAAVPMLQEPSMVGREGLRTPSVPGPPPPLTGKEREALSRPFAGAGASVTPPAPTSPGPSPKGGGAPAPTKKDITPEKK
jgi:NADH-quinone oxidoreductase subunit N